MTEVTKMEPQGAQTPVMRAADQMVAMIERVVTDPSADLDKLERMLAMKERMDAQSAKVAFAQAISAARAEIPPIMKDATVDFSNKEGKRTHYQHETLAGIARVIDPILSQHGLSYRFRTSQDGGAVEVTCIIAHADGHSEETSLRGAPDQSGNKNNFQAVGSAVTYFQRYTLKAALGLSAAADDDAQGAGPRPEDRRGPATVSPDQFVKLRDKCEEADVDPAMICERAKVPSLEQFPAADFDAVMRKLQLTIDQKKPTIEGDEIPY
ncbi:ERF family protein [Maritimibacter sp. UBA3975]|uniref:ERF family protein n=1 Tax=Maritimibacter sp. UBA3975 TaxID=1946833 RepID=UPI0025B89B38|nr:ERF family protein [Maritimibacter sp. UBA3975]|tara:strand:+ start:5496 stop:6296 length:801 start_codon:yes stop_codon:yes gene_type:complete